jgi:hypothetical protein
MRKWLLRGLVAGVVLLGLIQLVPYGRNHTNPPVTREVTWDSARTRELAVGACFDCHSNLTKWNLPSRVAPFSWLIYADVQGGRSALNFTEWDKPQDTSSQDVVESVQSGSMPPWQYKPIHPAARLSSTEKADLVAGLTRTLAKDPPIAGGGG